METIVKFLMVVALIFFFYQKMSPEQSQRNMVKLGNTWPWASKLNHERRHSMKWEEMLEEMRREQEREDEERRERRERVEEEIIRKDLIIFK